MDSIILAGGYAKRMAPITDETPKQLLPVNGKPMLSYVLDSLTEFHTLQGGKCYLSINKKYKSDFKEFLKYTKVNYPLELIVEDTKSEEKKLGSMGALDKIIKGGKVSTKPGILVIGGDNLFSLNIQKFYDAFMLKAKEALLNSSHSHNKHTPPSLFAIYNIGDLEKAKLYGTVKLNDKYSIPEDIPKTFLEAFKEGVKTISLSPILKMYLEKELASRPINEYELKKDFSFQEKTANPESTWVSTAIYIFSNTEIENLEKYLSETKSNDAIGNFIQWVNNQSEDYIPLGDIGLPHELPRIIAYPFEGYWFDIGNFEIYTEANAFSRNPFTGKGLKKLLGESKCEELRKEWDDI